MNILSSTVYVTSPFSFFTDEFFNTIETRRLAYHFPTARLASSIVCFFLTYLARMKLFLRLEGIRRK